MPTTKSAQDTMGTIDRFIQEVGAAEKRAAEANTEAGSIGGETSHPVKNVDDRTEPAKEGERSSENEKDVKEDQGAPGVNSAPEAKAAFDLARFAAPTRVKKAEGGAVQTPGSASDDQLQIGTKKEPTGEDPSVETSSAKSGKEDPGSSHPARTDNDSLDGHKYSADKLEELSLEQLAKIASDCGNVLVAAIAADEPAAAPAQTKRAADAQVAQQAGWELAGLVGGTFDKKAADALVQEKIEQIIKTASDDADNVALYLNSYNDQLQKAAEGPGDMAGGAMPPPPPGGGIPMGGAPGGAPGGEMGGGGDDLMAALGGAGGGAPGGDMGGAPGGAPGGEMGGAPGGMDPQVLELAQILSQMGVTPEELEQAMAAEGGAGGAPGGAPGGEAGGPPADDNAPAATPESEPGNKEPPKTAHDKTAATKRGNTNAGVREYIQEVISRSRRK